MIEQGLPFLVVAGIALASFAVNLVFGLRVSDAVSAGALEVNTPWSRPRLLAGKPLVALWFVAALGFLATLPGVVGIDAAVARTAWVPALGAIGFMTIAAATYKRSLALQPSDALDERERGVRELVYLIAYRIVASTFFGVVLAGYLAVSAGTVWIDWGSIPGDTIVGGAILAATFIWVLPSLVHAWWDPTPDEMDDETLEAWNHVKRAFGRGRTQRPERGRKRDAEVALADQGPGAGPAGAGSPSGK